LAACASERQQDRPAVHRLDQLRARGQARRSGQGRPRHGGPARRYDVVSIASPATIHDGPPLAPADLRKLEDWIALNREALLDYWNCKLTTDEVMERLRGV
jgi:hypothetical protein